MIISGTNIAAVQHALANAMIDQKRWLAFDNSIPTLTKKDLHLFATYQDGLDFQDFNQSNKREICLLPLESTHDFINLSIEGLLPHEIGHANIILDTDVINKLHQEYELTLTLSGFAELLDSFNWSKVFFDPLEANTEADTLEEKNEFQRLEYLVEELSAFSLTSKEAGAGVKELLTNYWNGTAMEAQIKDVLRGVYVAPERSKLFTTINHKNMNMENLEFLKNNLKYLGFGESLYQALEKHIKALDKEFQLPFSTEFGSRTLEATLSFRKSDSSDMYFFNSYTASIERSNGEKREQSFAITKGKGITVKEAYNLLQGRSVKKTLTNYKGEEYQAWMHLDFTKKDEKGNHQVVKYGDIQGYDLRDAVAKFPFLELDGADKEKELLRSLERGNTQRVTLEKDGQEIKVFIEANPSYKTINVYDEGFTLMKHETLPLAVRTQSQTQGVGEGAEQTQGQSVNGKEQKQGQVQGEKVKDKPTTTQKPRQRIS